MQYSSTCSLVDSMHRLHCNQCMLSYLFYDSLMLYVSINNQLVMWLFIKQLNMEYSIAVQYLTFNLKIFQNVK